MSTMKRRIEALEGRPEADDQHLVGVVFEREANVTAWLLGSGGAAREKSAVWAYLLKSIDGRSRGLLTPRKDEASCI